MAVRQQHPLRLRCQKNELLLEKVKLLNPRH